MEQSDFVVTCESCQTKFKLDLRRLKGARSKVRCSRCRHVFFVTPPPPEEETVLINLDEFEANDGAETGTDEVSGKGASSPDSSREDSPNAGEKPRRKIPLYIPLAIISMAAVLVVGFVLFKVGVFSSHSKHAEVEEPKTKNVQEAKELQERVPLAKKEEPPVTMSPKTQAYFVENIGAGQIFVVEGEVVNESQRAVSFIMIEGKLYTTDDKVVQTQKCFSGNPMTHDELTNMTVAEFQKKMMNREGQNMANTTIAPQGHVPFTLVFHNLPELDVC